MQRIQRIFTIFFAGLLIWLSDCVFAQQIYQFDIAIQPDQCGKGSAVLKITGTDADDAVTISWSSGQQNVTTVDQLTEGDYQVSIAINAHIDSLSSDTTLNFTIKKELCEVVVSSHFTPNGDGFNDVLGVGQTGSHPNFQFDIFNKWGQRVFSQKSVYVPWDGKSSGIDVPDGTYYYIFFYDANNKNKFAKGNITILR